MKYKNGYLYVQTDNGIVRVKAEAVSEERAQVEWRANIEVAPLDEHSSASIGSAHMTTTTLKDAFERHAIECTEWEQMEHLAKLAEGCGLKTQKTLFNHKSFDKGDAYFINEGSSFGNIPKVSISGYDAIDYHTFISTYCPEIGIPSHTVTPNEQDWQLRWRKVEADKSYESVLLMGSRLLPMDYECKGIELLKCGYTHYIPQSLLLNLPTE